MTTIRPSRTLGDANIVDHEGANLKDGRFNLWDRQFGHPKHLHIPDLLIAEYYRFSRLKICLHLFERGLA